MNSSTNLHAFGMIGLGTMGRNLLLNMADHGFNVTGYDPNENQINLLEQESLKQPIKGFTNIQPFISSLALPRTIMLLVPAGQVVDNVIQELLPLLSDGDLIIDGGNSHFTDTERRSQELKNKNIHFFGMGVSGGEKGARFGPSLMPGGDKQAYQIMEPILSAVSAKVNNESCVTYIGPGASGHYVKMVHNGIEYTLMQLISECYSYMQDGLKMSNQEVDEVFKKWNEGRLASYLMEITTDIFNFKEEGSEEYLINLIKDEARAKGTGKWTSQAAMDIQAPIPSIDTSVAMRDLSKYKSLRVEASKTYGINSTIEGNKAQLLEELEQAMYFSMIITYAQGMHMLHLASLELNYSLNLAEISRIWRGGCIIRAAFLEDMYDAYKAQPTLEHLLLDNNVSNKVKSCINGIKNTTIGAIKNGISFPAFTSTLSYFDSFRAAKMPTNLIQAQRDYFGAHKYERIDKEGLFHTDWN